MAQRKQPLLRKIVTALLAVGVGLVILATVFGNPWSEDRFWDPIRAGARGVGAIAILVGVVGWFYLAIPRIGSDAGKLWRRSQVSGVVTLALCILLATELVRFNLVRIEGAPLFFGIFLSLIVLLGCKLLLESALWMTGFLDRAVHRADEKHDGSSFPRR